MKRVKILFITSLILTLVSCSKNDENGNTQLVPWDAGYIPFYPGNYWVYEHYKIDTLGNETYQEIYDSVAITGTTTIDGIPFIVFEGTWMSGPEPMDTVYMLRDSSGYYVDPAGWIHLSDNNFTDTLAHRSLVMQNGDTLYESWYKMDEGFVIVNVPAGSFETLNYKGTIRTIDPAPHVQEIRYKNQFYAKNIGQILDTYFYLGSPNRFERRLKRYFIDQQSSH